MNSINFTHEDMIGFIRKLLELYPEAAEPKHGRCNTCRYMTKDELCTRYEDENGTHSTMPEGYCWLWERRMDEVEE